MVATNGSIGNLERSCRNTGQISGSVERSRPPLFSIPRHGAWRKGCVRLVFPDEFVRGPAFSSVPHSPLRPKQQFIENFSGSFEWSLVFPVSIFCRQRDRNQPRGDRLPYVPVAL
jgi:hypothetical protein